MAVRPVIPQLRLPRAGGGVVDGAAFNAAMQQIERADTANLKTGQTPNLPAIILTAGDGSSWRITVSAAGVLQTAAVPR